MLNDMHCWITLCRIQYTITKCLLEGDMNIYQNLNCCLLAYWEDPSCH